MIKCNFEFSYSMCFLFHMVPFVERYEISANSNCDRKDAYRRKNCSQAVFHDK